MMLSLIMLYIYHVDHVMLMQRSCVLEWSLNIIFALFEQLNVVRSYLDCIDICLFVIMYPIIVCRHLQDPHPCERNDF